ncbi:MAG: hypothetical protein OXC46_05380, partial [Thaumarchaeota archaeon]|nr:hypothetical protein [Nitrososphaerota archaeon]
DDLIALSWHALQVGKCQILIVLNLVGYNGIVVNAITESHEHVVFYGTVRAIAFTLHPSSHEACIQFSRW